MATTAAGYLEQIDQTDVRELGQLLELSRAVVTDNVLLTRDDRDTLTALILEKVEQGIYQLRAQRRQLKAQLMRERLGMYSGDLPGLPPLLMPKLELGWA
jgi:hypothetical protein